MPRSVLDIYILTYKLWKSGQMSYSHRYQKWNTDVGSACAYLDREYPDNPMGSALICLPDLEWSPRRSNHKPLSYRENKLSELGEITQDPDS